MNNRIEQISHSMDLDEQMPLHRKGWNWQPVGKALILAIMIAGLLGLFGEGLFSRQTLRQGNASIEYERFFRHEGEMKLDIIATGVAGRSAVSFPLTYLRDLKIKGIQPEPESSFIRSGQMWFVFPAEQNLQVKFRLEPISFGNLHGAVWVNEQYLVFSHFIFP